VCVNKILYYHLKVSLSIDFLQLTFGEILELLEFHHCQKILYEAVKRWINYNKEARIEFFEILTAQIRLEYLPADVRVKFIL
jgi:BTB And C-terminal Kelch